ncbi:hypothetical protein BCR34DRAFT_582410 [Clohesyomyces aquaticus]|uniref:Uncharacterized protein n=1 Tax=Clohesyomyces aquaticus TaxID=1231657 RepID=A0A1Y2A9R5_9PLEO|nr:hypothetical protein BCR34DRAFT_582410 [Clohesyomyces aquaticus]
MPQPAAASIAAHNHQSLVLTPPAPSMDPNQHSLRGRRSRSPSPILSSSPPPNILDNTPSSPQTPTEAYVKAILRVINKLDKAKVGLLVELSYLEALVENAILGEDDMKLNLEQARSIEKAFVNVRGSKSRFSFRAVLSCATARKG